MVILEILQGLAKACNFIKKETLAQVFSCQFCEISKNTLFTEHLRLTACGVTPSSRRLGQD